ncbi:MAG: acetolactate synthase 3 regulatory subunit [Candidatus Methanoperedens nitroreducens]|uniref:Acetolactate synthase small subunit n=1 Tax=Candidatus Methanoperedens nitratireducens TaxID=1392998 RepID=A0A0P8DXT7_9EURY|nr:acetolactate synthase small subunit [Candidatus Methanoperedens sp. BLZ2]KAB2943045.1 MAG: acetolactate synthase small subunit [Candidatus Methanoperedens sp.]KPQ42532.1 MAG: acetolactate synthase 3 regulatory subunit [Candidatus Methanoperedens sp. BLZ1]MBZ0176497.1 acetolactate synthase small subunit [Candidatus Methanoperedens nitroreducens]CAG0965742.1 acetolactate synthase I/III small subunit [Methanosarcinales archaeon]MCX9078341.1 acetolactate synthase small subunit [Candidatus Metha
MKHTLAILVENKPGVLTRVAGLFSRRGFNIESLAVGVTENKDISRITILVSGDDNILEQVEKQLNKLIDVIRVSDIPADESVNRELALIKVGVDTTTRAEVMQIVDIFRAKIVDVGIKSLVIEVTGDESKINAMEQLLRQFGIKEMVRTGKIAMNRGAKLVQSEKR